MENIKLLHRTQIDSQTIEYGRNIIIIIQIKMYFISKKKNC